MNIRENWESLVIDFCNISDWTDNTILEIQKYYRIDYKFESLDRGIKNYCVAKDDKRKRWFALLEDEDIKTWKEDFESRLPSKFKPHIVLPSEDDHKELWIYLQNSQEKFQSFLNQCSEGTINSQFINEAVNNFEGVKLELKFTESDKTWNSTISHKPPKLWSFEDYVYWEILELCLINIADQILPYIKLCTKCKKYYIAKKQILNQKFCSDKCRMDWHNRKRIDSGDARRDKRDRRKNGLDQ